MNDYFGEVNCGIAFHITEENLFNTIFVPKCYRLKTRGSKMRLTGISNKMIEKSNTICWITYKRILQYISRHGWVKYNFILTTNILVRSYSWIWKEKKALWGIFIYLIRHVKKKIQWSKNILFLTSNIFAQSFTVLFLLFSFNSS